MKTPKSIILGLTLALATSSVSFAQGNPCNPCGGKNMKSMGDHNFINQYAFQKIADMSGKAFPADVTEMTMEYIDTLNKPMESEKELRIGLADLRPNMKLTRDTYTMSGLLLVTKGSILTLQGITRIRSIARVDPIAGEIYITYENRKQALSRV